MTSDLYWYFLDSNEGALVTAGGGAVEVHSFLGPLSARDGERRFSLRLWRASTRPHEMSETEREMARRDCVVAVGSADELAVELRRTEGATNVRYQVGRRRGDTQTSASPRALRFNLGHEVTVHTDEVFDAQEAAALFLSYYQTGTVPTTEYRLRELSSPDILTDHDNPTHVLTINYDNERPVLPTVALGEFSAFLADAGENKSSVLVLSRLPPGKTMEELTDEERSTNDEFMQTAGSSGRYTVELRKHVGDTSKLYTVGRQVDYLVWNTASDTEIAVGDKMLHVYPNEVLTPAEVDALFVHYTRTGDLPKDGYIVGEIELAE